MPLALYCSALIQTPQTLINSADLQSLLADLLPANLNLSREIRGPVIGRDLRTIMGSQR